MKPHQIISLMDYFDADNTFAMADHDDHVHVGYAPQHGARFVDSTNSSPQVLKPEQWRRLIDRLGDRQPGGPHLAVEVRGAGEEAARQGRLPGPPRRVAGRGDRRLAGRAETRNDL